MWDPWFQRIIWLSKKIYGTTGNIAKRELKWTIELGRNPGIFFWNNCYKLNSEIFYNNKIKWLQYQITRNCLKTNIIVSKFTDTSPLCTFCGIANESISHLFWDCNNVKLFINTVYTQCENTGFYTAHTKNSFLFGAHPGLGNKNINLFAYYLKLFIWTRRCKNIICRLDNFIIWFNFEIEILKLAYTDNDWIQSLDQI